MALAHLARSHALLGNVAEAVRHGREALRLAEEVGHRYSVMNALGSLGDVLMTRGELEEAISLFERFASLARENEVGVHVTASLGYALVLSGRVREGIALFENECAAIDGAGWELFKARALASLGHAYLVAGRLHDAERRGHDALALARHRGERGAEGWALWLLAETAARQEPAARDDASARYAEALALAGQLGLRPLMAYCHGGLGRLLGRARHPDAEAHVRRAATLAREMEITLWRWPGETLAPGPATP
jgi:tetratricopeptide (TPR) repeat protein